MDEHHPQSWSGAARELAVGQVVSTTAVVMSTGVDSAKPNISESSAGFPVGEWLMVAVSLYSPTWGVGGATRNLWLNCSGLTPPVMETMSGPAMRPFIVPTPSISFLNTHTIHDPPPTAVPP